MRTSPLTSLVRFGSVTSFALLASCAGPRLSSDLFADPNEAPQDWHRGPGVFIADTGPARFVGPLFGAFDKERAMKVVRFTDRYYRAPANPGYDAVLDRVAEELRDVGFGDDPRLQLGFLVDETNAPAWTPKSGSVALHVPGKRPQVLHAFEKPEDVDRVMLPINAPSCGIEGNVALDLDHLEEGMVFVTEVSLRQVLRRARARGAAAVLSASLGTYNVDPSGGERHLDAIQFRSVAAGGEVPVAQISPRSFALIESAYAEAQGRNVDVRISLQAEVELEERPLRTLVAVIEGADRPDEAVAMCSHVQEPGACDNASGVAGLAESARALVPLLREGTVAWPSRSLVFCWGDEFAQTRSWLDATEKTCVAGISSDMTGQSKDTGAIALLERMPDPGALVTLPPDVHTPWGAGDVDEDALRPNGLSIIARCAMIDVGRLDGDWQSADHPWEGGSDHDVFIELGIPAVLFWHFTDFTYHTSLDRMEFVDASEVHRTAVALLSTALATADPKPGDLERYLKSLDMEKEVRLDAAAEAEDDELAGQWEEWCRGSREWLRNHCLGIDEPLPPQGR